jgi:formylmethanofuran dehydrogenase subunit E
MTFIEIEDAPCDTETVEQNQTIKCSWCGEIIRAQGDELALAMCQSCYQRLLNDYVSEQQPEPQPPNASDR